MEFHRRKAMHGEISSSFYHVCQSFQRFMFQAIETAEIRKPPRRKEGGGFIIADIMSGLKSVDTDPFLIWHELPRHSYLPGEMPGAPMHPHRGFNEVPYCKEMSGTEGLNFMLCRDNEDNTAQMTPGRKWGKKK